MLKPLKWLNGNQAHSYVAWLEKAGTYPYYKVRRPLSSIEHYTTSYYGPKGHHRGLGESSSAEHAKMLCEDHHLANGTDE